MQKIEIIKVFGYKKDNDRYWNKTKLYQQVVKKVLCITKIFYPDYLLLFLFPNGTSYFIYAKNVLQAKNIDKKFEKEQIVL